MVKVVLQVQYLGLMKVVLKVSDFLGVEPYKMQQKKVALQTSLRIHVLQSIGSKVEKLPFVEIKIVYLSDLYVW